MPGHSRVPFRVSVTPTNVSDETCGLCPIAVAGSVSVDSILCVGAPFQLVAVPIVTVGVAFPADARRSSTTTTAML